MVIINIFSEWLLLLSFLMDSLSERSIHCWKWDIDVSIDIELLSISPLLSVSICLVYHHTPIKQDVRKESLEDVVYQFEVVPSAPSLLRFYWLRIWEYLLHLIYIHSDDQVFLLYFANMVNYIDFSVVAQPFILE